MNHPFLHYTALLVNKTWEQLYLVLIALFFAIIIGVVLGIIATSVKKLRTPIVATANIFQTIPSLALFGLLLPVFGIGAPSAILALIIYSILPIVRNTITAIDSVPKAMHEAADSLGFKPWQKLYFVEIPLTLPMIIAGIRTASVMCVGIATIAAFIGAGGLGDFIYQGLALNNNRLILLGAIPAAIMALSFDYSIAYLQKRLANKKRQASPARKLKKRYVGILMLLLIVIVIFLFNRPTKNTITIGTKNFTEQLILGNIMAALIEHDTNLTVIKKFNLGSTSLLQAAIQRGDIDLYPEYTGTAYLVVLKQKYQSSLTAGALYHQVKTLYQKKYHLSWLQPFGFQDTQTLAVTQNFAKTHQLHTLSDLKKIKRLTIAAPLDFIQRPDGLKGLSQTYRLTFAKIMPLEPDFLYPALTHHQVKTIVAFTTDPRIHAYHLTLLKDNLHIYPNYDAAPVVRDATLKKYPQLKSVLQKLVGKIDAQKMQAMNAEVTLQHESPARVARQFLVKTHLIST
jgi:osmoprotectant transport system permease protein